MTQPPTGRRVLLADDSLVGQKIAVRMLEQLGYTVDVVVNGREAVDAVGSADYDIVLMDCQMPVMDGYEAAVEIRRVQGDDRYTPIIAMTASETTPDIEKALASGMDAHVSKPVTIEELAAILEGVSERALAGGSARCAGPDDPALDPEIIESLKELDAGSGTFFPAFMGAFLTGTEERFEELQRALTGEGWRARTAAVVHAIKGSCSSAGAASCARICKEMEKALEDADRARLTKLVAGLREELDRVRTELNDGFAATDPPTEIDASA